VGLGTRRGRRRRSGRGGAHLYTVLLSVIKVRTTGLDLAIPTVKVGKANTVLFRN
jgi:hypothetical protein